MKILLCCGAGMSSGFMAQRARRAAKKMKIDISVEAHSHSDVLPYLSNVDILMIGPHYIGEYEEFKRLAKPYHIPVCVISKEIYGNLDGEGLIKVAQEEISNFKK
ncbi:MAG: PTS sugar transporter subunit IIB [Coprobacillus sp.]|nr:PTS sugar transporter subunit IIB [Coprobacillus sp.]